MIKTNTAWNEQRVRSKTLEAFKWSCLIWIMLEIPQMCIEKTCLVFIIGNLGRKLGEINRFSQVEFSRKSTVLER